MNLNKEKNIIVIIASLFLFTALVDGLPYGFFTLLRFVVFGVTAYVAWMAYEHQRKKWIWIFSFLAILFNPFIPVYLSRGLWCAIDLVTGLFLVSSVFALNFPRTEVR